MKAARYVDALGAFEPPPELIPEARGFLEAVLGEAPPLEEALERANELHPMLGALVEPLLSLTLSPTMIEASHKRNVIPALCEVTVDCRLLPEQTPADVEPLIRAALGDGRLRARVARGGRRTRSPIETPLWDALDSLRRGARARRGARSHRLPGLHGQPLPARGVRDGRVRLLPGEGDGPGGRGEARALRERAIAVDDLEAGVHMLRHVARSLLG